MNRKSMAATTNPVPRIACGLGRAGLLPFVAAPLALVLLPDSAALVGRMLAEYSLAIMAFLLGVWWGLGLIRRNGAGLIMSNAWFLAAFAAKVLLPPPLFLLVCAMLLLIALVTEGHHELFRPQPRYYRRLRMELTVVASASLLLTAALL